ncbi:MAG: lipid-A-disaccharide synthase [Cytophagales bacterium]
MKYYIIAGERSGDLHGSNLVKELKKLDGTATFRGLGGEEMERNGVSLHFHYGQLAFMGFLAVINFFKIAAYMKQCQRDVLQYKPDALILIDYGGFNRQMAKFGKRNQIKILYYIPPKVWAWRQARAWSLKENADQLYVILPFEKEFYKRYGMDVNYVGNPVLDAIKSFQPNQNFQSEQQIPSDKKIIALLPGSRKMELERIVPLMAEVAKQNPSFQFVVAAVDNLPEYLYASFKQLNNVKFVYNQTYDLLLRARSAVVTSGTATLETALLNVPQVVVYKAGGLEYSIAKSVVKVKFISLVNLIANREVVKELIQADANPAKLQQELTAITKETEQRQQMLESYKKIYQTLDTGSASANTAKLMFDYLTKVGGQR